MTDSITKIAPLYKRVLATLIDIVLFSIVLTIGLLIDELLIKSKVVSNIFEICYIVITIYYTSKFGKTLGKYIMKIKILNNDLTHLTYLKSTLRFLTYMIYIIPFAFIYEYTLFYLILNIHTLNLIFTLFPFIMIIIYILLVSVPFYYLRKDKKLLHDIITKTIVIKDSNGKK